MLQSLVKCPCTRRATASLAFGSPPIAASTSRRFYANKLNGNIVDFLKECEQKERESVDCNRYKIRSFRMAASVIEELDFKVQHADELKSVRRIGPGIMSRINAFLGHETALPTERKPVRAPAKKLMAVPGIGRKSAEALYAAGCDTIGKLHLKKYKETLTPTAKRGLKYIEHLESPVPRGNAEAIAELCRGLLPVDKYEITIAGDYRREAPTLSGIIEILIIDGSTTDPIPTPPHPSTLKPPDLHKPTRTGIPFIQQYTSVKEMAMSVLMNEVIKPLENMGVVSDTTTPGTNLWQGWLRVPKGGSWGTRQERIEGIQKLNGDFHRVNITCIPKRSRGSALLALTGDEDYYFDCRRRAVQAGLYLNEWGLWEWEPDSQSLSQSETPYTPHEKTSLGAMWGSETEADKGRWVQLETFEEEQILDAVGGEYVPPSKRNFRFIVGKTRPKRAALHS